MAMRVYKDPFAEAKAKKKEEKRKRDAKNEAGEKDKKQRGIADCAGWTDAGVKAALDRREAERNAGAAGAAMCGHPEVYG